MNTKSTINMKKFIHRRVNSVKWAWSGLWRFFSTETHAVLHLISAVIVVVLGFLFDVTPLEWVALILAIGLVIQAEIWNTVLEKVADFVQAEYDLRIKVIKDLSAAAVLWCACVAIVIGFLVFTPYVLDRL